MPVRKRILAQVEAVVYKDVEEYQRAIHVLSFGVPLAFCHELATEDHPSHAGVQGPGNSLKLAYVLRERRVVSVTHNRCLAVGEDDCAIPVELRLGKVRPVIELGKEPGMDSVLRPRWVKVLEVI